MHTTLFIADTVRLCRAMSASGAKVQNGLLSTNSVMGNVKHMQVLESSKWRDTLLDMPLQSQCIQVSPEHGEDIVSDELLPEIINVDLLDSEFFSPFACRLQLLSLQLHLSSVLTLEGTRAVFELR